MHNINATARSSPIRRKERRASRKFRDRKRNKRRSDAEIQSRPYISKALSAAADKWSSVNITTAESFAKRPVETRQSEAAAVGKVKRPLNAFMLYRMAYHHVAKAEYGRNNSAQVSVLCGVSWKTLEPKCVIVHFEQLASKERQLHEAAFPNYRLQRRPNRKVPCDEELVAPEQSTASLRESGFHESVGDRWCVYCSTIFHYPLSFDEPSSTQLSSPRCTCPQFLPRAEFSSGSRCISSPSIEDNTPHDDSTYDNWSATSMISSGSGFMNDEYIDNGAMRQHLSFDPSYPFLLQQTGPYGRLLSTATTWVNI